MNSWQMLVALSGVAGILTLTFLLGYNWRRVTVLEEIVKDFARRDIIDLELKAIRSRLDYMSKQLNAVIRGNHRVPEEDEGATG